MLSSFYELKKLYFFNQLMFFLTFFQSKKTHPMDPLEASTNLCAAKEAQKEAGGVVSKAKEAVAATRTRGR